MNRPEILKRLKELEPLLDKFLEKTDDHSFCRYQNKLHNEYYNLQVELKKSMAEVDNL